MGRPEILSPSWTWRYQTDPMDPNKKDIFLITILWNSVVILLWLIITLAEINGQPYPKYLRDFRSLGPLKCCCRKTVVVALSPGVVDPDHFYTDHRGYNNKSILTCPCHGVSSISQRVTEEWRVYIC